MNKEFTFGDVKVFLRLSDDHIEMAILWEVSKDMERDFDGWFMLGPSPYSDPIDYCHRIFKKENRIIMPFFNLTHALLNEKICKLAIHFVQTERYHPIYQKISSPEIDLTEIRESIGIPEEFIANDLTCQICQDKRPFHALVTSYPKSHVVCDNCSSSLARCPFTRRKILYSLDISNYLSLQRLLKDLS